MKSILLSIKPEWVAKILNGEKTIEVRKKFPKNYVGWVYIYCCKSDNLCRISKISQDRYICGKDFDTRDFPHLSSGYEGKGKVVARFWCDKVEGFYDFDDDLCKSSCLDRGSMLDYLGNKNGYAIHISKLEIFDRPRELKEFSYYIKRANRVCYLMPVYLTKAPQNYCYVEGEE